MLFRSLVSEFPQLTGPCPVGTIDVELPVAELDSQASSSSWTFFHTPEEEIKTISYRVFYPCVPETGREYKPEYWIPHPQRQYLASLAGFLGVGKWGAEVLSILPRNLYHIRLPVLAGAPLLEPSNFKKLWPVFVFSHGLYGSRNTYSYLLASLASHGIVVIAPEHRDGSSCASYVRDIPLPSSSSKDSRTDRSSWLSSRNQQRKYEKIVAYNSYPHTRTPEVERGRNNMLRIRLWELGLLHSSLLDLSCGHKKTNLADEPSSETLASMFKGKIDVHTPGRMIWGGHSFGAASMVQLLKSVYYAPESHKAPDTYNPLFVPAESSPISKEITNQTQVVLLDMWVFTLSFSATEWINKKPLPCYDIREDKHNAERGRGGYSILAIESQQFFKWKDHLTITKRVLSSGNATLIPNTSASSTSNQSSKARPNTDVEHENLHSPHFFYTASSAHSSHSDWGVLFPWLSKKAFGAEEGERVLRLNVAAILEFLHLGGNATEGKVEVEGVGNYQGEQLESPPSNQGAKVLLRRDADVRGWNWIDTKLTKEEAGG